MKSRNMSAKLPEHPPVWAPTPAPIILSPSPSTSSIDLHKSQPSRSAIDFSPPLVIMVVIAAFAFLTIAYSRFISNHLFPPLRRIMRRYRRWRSRRRLRPHFPPSDTDSFPPHFDSSDGFYVYSPYGLDDSAINNIPLTIFKPPRGSKSSKFDFIEVDDFHDCAVCLLEFEDGDYMRTLPHCCHSFHADCIDMWLRAHATCPICRAGALFAPQPPESPMMPLMAARIRPSLDEGILLESIISGEIHPARNETMFSPERRTIQSEDHRCNRRELDLLLKRSYSFSFERSFASERQSFALETATTPHRWSLWIKRPSSSTPFSSLVKSRVFRRKSPGIFRRRSILPMSESSASMRYGGGTSWRMKSPMWRMRLGHPEALISPERVEGDVEGGWP